MTDKQIIIDGVDVAGCDFYDKDKGYCLTLKMYPKGFKNPSCFSGDFQECIQDSKTCPYTFCHSNSNCYYKQLVRRTKECEKMRYYLNKIRQDELSKLNIEWDEYITECTCTDYSNIINLVEEALKERSSEG